MQGLTEGDQWRLDLFEGSQYKRVEVQSRLLREEGEGGLGGEVEEGKQVRAETYVWKDGVGELEDGEWDFEVFRREKMGRWVGSEEEYEGELRPSIADLFFVISGMREEWDG